ncbi:MAG: FtsX-like permease family protein [Pseudomonadota bacterium]|nr:FtsX-like permease family protein [Pseudomonadota bacterium]
MRALDHKRWRDFWKMRGQVLAIGLVIAAGVAIYVMSLSTLDSLTLTRQTYYRDYRFADVFVSLKRAPLSFKERLQEIAGVEQLRTRVVAAANLTVPGFHEPISGHLISCPIPGVTPLNSLYLRRGRLVDPGRDDEVVVSEAFAKAHNFTLGETLTATINGRRKILRIVGIALSPEFVYQLQPGSLFPDFKRYGILWMGRKALANAYDMDGAFNDLLIKLAKGTRPEEVIERLDRLLEPYGGLGAYARREQISHRFLTEEFRQLEQMATIYPAIFLAVAAFLLHVVISRLITTEREQIAILKAFGYYDRDIAFHYFKLVLMIVSVGVGIGLIAGFWLGQNLSEIYMDYYRFPFLLYTLHPRIVVFVVGVSLAAAGLGTGGALRRVVKLAPAVAMRPEPPASYRPSWPERFGLKDFFSQPTRMIIRHLGRRPFKAALSVIGIALACAILMVGSIFQDAVDYIVEVQFGLAQREDLTVTFVEPSAYRALLSLQRLPGVDQGEPFRSVPVRLRFRQRHYLTAVVGMPEDSVLHRLLDENLKSLKPPEAGIVLTDQLGSILKVKPGERLTLEVLEGKRPQLQVTVAGLSKEFIGVSAYMELSALNRLMREDNLISGAYLAVDESQLASIYKALDEMPRVAGTVARRHAVTSFYETMADQMLVFTFFIIFFAGVIAFGVVYNSARITLSERARELASLRILGFRRLEIAYILLGELAILTLVAIPLGFLLGYGLCAYIIYSLQTDLYRIPLLVEPGTYAFAATVIILATALSSGLVGWRIQRLDLIAVLKTRE